MKNTLFLIFLAFVLFLAIYFYWGQSQAESQLASANTKITSLEQQLQRYTHSAPPVQNPAPKDTTARPNPNNLEEDIVTPPPSTTFEDELGTLSAGDIQRLQRKGLKNPEADLMNDLMRRQKTILNATGSMGGTMAIRDIRILNDRYAMAYFEDGHNGGHMLLKYAVADGTITWTRLDSYKL
ncbi:hypothetical protein [Nibribacter koreensis]|uniref:Uncharacterized protein n=1 Tax=Nibribacter koreensis TaxID=1084519 RepID=A0ABP8FIX9_9BACT